jgi:uncharacterized protein YraI
MKKKSINIKNLIMLSAFAASFSVIAFAVASSERATANVPSASLSREIVVAPIASSIDTAASEALSLCNEQTTETVEVSTESADATLERTVFTVTEYESPITMYTSDTVNVRSGAGTDYDKLGKLRWGSEAQVTGETDNGWYEVAYGDTTAFIIGDYMVSELPGTPLVFVGDSRTVQMQYAVGSSDKAYIAKVGEGYSWFKSTALPEISNYAGAGTTMIINFGVNDLANASNYINLVNSNIDSWINAGITVCYAAVTPVGNCGSVSNSQIEKFNTKLQSELDPRIKWIDGYSYLNQTGFSTPDGLHYTYDTYRNLYSYYMASINEI